MSEPNDDAFVADLLASERRRPAVPPAAAQALFESIAIATASERARATEAPPPATSASAGSSWLASRPVIALVSLALGAGVGAMVRPLFDPPPPAPALAVAAPATAGPRDVPSPPSSDGPTTRPDDLPTAPPSLRRAASVPVPAPAASPPIIAKASPPETSLGAERAIIDTARSALARGDASAALVSLEAHEKSHPRGQLDEERDALFVQAFALSGQSRVAVERAARFRLAYPSSVFLPAVDAAVR